MSKQYDFHKQIPVIKDKQLSESVVTEPKEYDFDKPLTEFMQKIGKYATDVARKGYIRNALAGAAGGAGIGGAMGVLSNELKSDSDPTKKNTFNSFMKGASRGAGLGAVAGVAAKSIVGRHATDLQAAAIKDSMVKAAQKAQAAGLKGKQFQKFVDDAGKMSASRMGIDPTKVKTIIQDILN